MVKLLNLLGTTVYNWFDVVIDKHTVLNYGFPPYPIDTESSSAHGRAQAARNRRFDVVNDSLTFNRHSNTNKDNRNQTLPIQNKHYHSMFGFTFIFKI